MKQLLISLCLLISLLTPGVDTQAQTTTTPPSSNNPPYPVGGNPFPMEKIQGLRDTVQALRRAIAANAGSGTANVSPSTVKPITDGLYPVLLQSANQYGAVPGGQADQALPIEAALASRSLVTLEPGVYKVSRIRVPVGKTLEIGFGVVIKGMALTPAQQSLYGNNDHGVIEAAERGGVIGFGTVDGNAAERPGINSHGIYFINAPRVDVRGVTVTNCGGSGIRYQNAPGTVVIDAKVDHVGNIGIENIISSNTLIQGDKVEYALHAIQLWGDQASDNFCENIRIIACETRNIQGGGLWAHKARFVTITANTVEKCFDVGIDLENSTDCVASANTVRDCLKGGLTVFYASKRINFTGNTVDQGATFGPAVKIAAGGVSEDISFSGGSMVVRALATPLIFVEDSAAVRLSITDIQSATTTWGNGVTAQRVDRLTVTNCKFVVGGPYGIYTTGGSNGRIENNEIIYQGNSASSAKAVYLVWLSGQFPAQRNTIRGNIMPTFGLGIHNDMGGDNAGYNTIEDNVVTMVTTPGGQYDLSTIERNKNLTGDYVDGTPVNGVLTYATYAAAVSGTSGRKKPARVHVLNDVNRPDWVTGQPSLGVYDYVVGAALRPAL